MFNVYFARLYLQFSGPDGDGHYTFDCQHGPVECQGNIVQGCTVKYVSDVAMQVELINCMMDANYPPTAGKHCFQQFGLDYSEVEVRNAYGEYRRVYVHTTFNNERNIQKRPLFVGLG